jgi:hypothetical protein
VADLFSVKYGALALLVLQNTFLVIFMRYSRTTSGPLYASSTAVFMMEVRSCELPSLVTCLSSPNLSLVTWLFSSKLGASVLISSS